MISKRKVIFIMVQFY